MTQSNDHSRVCPTRVDGRAALFAHRVTSGKCQDRQRAQYHKCYACAFNNGYVAVHGEPVLPETAAEADAPVLVELASAEAHLRDGATVAAQPVESGASQSDPDPSEEGRDEEGQDDELPASPHTAAELPQSALPQSALPQSAAS